MVAACLASSAVFARSGAMQDVGDQPDPLGDGGRGGQRISGS